MSFPPVPGISKTKINKAGGILVIFIKTSIYSPTEFNWAVDVVTKWRVCHAYPINTFKSTLRSRLKNYKGSLAAQRLKRLPTIVNKLVRFPTMTLTSMQDIGGLRAILKTVKEVKSLSKIYKTKGLFRHQLVKEKDYIAHPKVDGYRGIHLVYKYDNKSAAQYNGLFIELQIRSKLQHSWATAVETMGTFLGQALKSTQGDKKWLEFFSLTSSAIAHLEKSPLVPGYEDLSEKETFKAVAKAEKELEVLNRIKNYSIAVNEISTKSRSSYYHLVTLNSVEKKVEIKSYAKGSLREASKEYTEYEKRAAAGEKIETVLVSAGPLRELRKAYPNFFLDVDDFINIVNNIISYS